MQFRSSLPAILLVVVPALLMVSTVRFRSFKTFDLQARRPFRVLIFFAALLIAIVTHPQSVLVVISYGYLVSPLIEMIDHAARAGSRPRLPQGNPHRRPASLLARARRWPRRSARRSASRS